MFESAFEPPSQIRLSFAFVIFDTDYGLGGRAGVSG